MGVMLATNLDVLMFALELLKACRILSDPILLGIEESRFELVNIEFFAMKDCR